MVMMMEMTRLGGARGVGSWLKEKGKGGGEAAIGGAEALASSLFLAKREGAFLFLRF